MNLNTWSEALISSFQNVLKGVMEFIPQLIIALVIFLFGWLIGAALSKVISQVIRSIKLDKMLESAGLNDLMKRIGVKLDSGKFLGELVKWFVIVVFLMAAFDILGLSQVNNFLQGVVIGYIPQVIAAVLILLVAVVIADVLQKTVIASARAARMSSASFLGSVTKWSIWVFAVLAALFQLGIGATFIQTFFTGVIVAISLAFGLSFGLGGKDAAARYIEKVRSEISETE